MSRGTSHKGLSEPPDGAVVGESVPRENESDSQYQREIEEIKGALKGRSPVFREMSDSELEERAREFHRRANE